MKTCSAIFFLLFSCFIFAQSPVDKGVWNIGGSMSYSNTSTEGSDNSFTIISFNPSVGYFLIDNFSAGITIDFTSRSLGGSDNSDLQIGPALRYYFSKDKVIPFIGASYRYSKWNLSSDYEYSSNTIEFSAGADFFVARNVAIEASVNYAIENQSLPEYLGLYYNDDVTTKALSIAIGLNFFLY